MLTPRFGRAGSGESPFPPDAPIHPLVCPSPAHLPCPSLDNWVLHTISKIWFKQRSWCATFAQPSLLCRGKGRCEEAVDLFPTFCVHTALSSLCLWSPCLSSSRASRKCLPDCQRSWKFQRDWKWGKQREKWGGRRQKLCLIFFHSLEIHSAFPRGLKFSLKTAV